MSLFNGNSIYNDGAGSGGGGGGDWEDVSNIITYDSFGSSTKLFYNSSCKLYNLVIDKYISSAAQETLYTIAFNGEIIADVNLYDFYTHDNRSRKKQKNHFSFGNIDFSSAYGNIQKDRFNFIFTDGASVTDCMMYVNILFRGL